MLRVKSEKDTDIELGQLGSAVVKEERGEADIALEEEQENLQNQESIVIEVEDAGRMLQADVKVEVLGVGEEEGGNQGAEGGVLGGNDQQHDQQDPGDNGEGGEAKGAKPKKERKKKDKKKKVKEEDDDPFEVKTRAGKNERFFEIGYFQEGIRVVNEDLELRMERDAEALPRYGWYEGGLGLFMLTSLGYGGGGEYVEETSNY